MAEPAEPAGIDFPVIDGRVSSTRTGRDVFSDAAAVTDPALSQRISATANWRKEYLRPTRDLVVSGMQAPGGTLAMCRDGLASLYRQFTLTESGDTTDIPTGFAAHTAPQFTTAEVIGHGPAVTELAIPHRGRQLTGADLRHQLDVWVADGIVEPSFAHALEAVMAHPQWLDLTGIHFAVLGAGAEMGPLTELLDWGATVWAVDLPKPELWRRILAEAQGRPGRLHVPVPVDGPDPATLTGVELADVAGADLLSQAPGIRTWLAQIEGPFTLGNYVYADGPVHVRTSLAIDAIGTDLLDSGHDIMLAWLATPTDVFAAPIEAVEESRRRWRSPGPWRYLRSPLRLAGQFEKNYPSTVHTASGFEYGISDCLVSQQGPNYLLAKRLQRWRAIVAREAGLRVSLNVAPSTRTSSVLKNRALAAAYAGASRFGLEIFDPETSNAIMAALLVHDLRNPESSANPDIALPHPMQLFIDGACHGGLWRSQYAARSVLGFAAVAGMFERNA